MAHWSEKNINLHICDGTRLCKFKHQLVSNISKRDTNWRNQFICDQSIASFISVSSIKGVNDSGNGCVLKMISKKQKLSTRAKYSNNVAHLLTSCRTMGLGWLFSNTGGLSLISSTVMVTKAKPAPLLGIPGIVTIAYLFLDTHIKAA